MSPTPERPPRLMADLIQRHRTGRGSTASREWRIRRGSMPQVLANVNLTKSPFLGPPRQGAVSDRVDRNATMRQEPEDSSDHAAASPAGNRGEAAPQRSLRGTIGHRLFSAHRRHRMTGSKGLGHGIRNESERRAITTDRVGGPPVLRSPTASPTSGNSSKDATNTTPPGPNPGSCNDQTNAGFFYFGVCHCAVAPGEGQSLRSTNGKRMTRAWNIRWLWLHGIRRRPTRVE